MPKTVTTYYIDELEGRARQRARDSVMEEYGESRGDWDEPILEAFREKMKSLGFDEIKLGYSHMFCQGRGASFSCKYPDWRQFLKAEKAQRRFYALIYQHNQDNLVLDYEINRSSSLYDHEGTMRCDFEYHWRNEVPKNEDHLVNLMDELNNYMLETARAHCVTLINELEDTDLAAIKDDVIEGWIKQQDITFDSEGKPFYPEEEDDDDYDTYD